MKKAKLLSLFMCIIMAAAMLAGCGGSTPADAPTPTPAPADGNDPTPTPAPTHTPAPADGNGSESAPGNGSGGDTTPDGGTQAILEGILGTVGETYELPVLMYTPLSNSMEYGEKGVAYFIGTKDVPFNDGVAAEAAIGAIPFSVALIQAEQNTDIENAKTLMRDGIDPAKWICAMADTVIVDNTGDFIILIMTSEEHTAGLGEAIHKAFLEK